MHIQTSEDAAKSLDQMPIGRGILPPKSGQSILEWIAFVEQNYGAVFVGIEDTRGQVHGIEAVRRVEEARIKMEADGRRPSENLQAQLQNLKEADDVTATLNQMESEKRIDEVIARMRASIQENANGVQGPIEK